MGVGTRNGLRKMDENEDRKRQECVLWLPYGCVWGPEEVE